MKRDLFNRTAGSRIRVDGTFRFAGRSMGRAKALVFYLSEDAHILGFVALETENWPDQVPMLLRYVFLFRVSTLL